ncbi:unnamed protein product [Allacma fusca]|uniref:XK-related protein n=1 Tax=Allacma fusca TaxID=39272 RepID=A0A8J2PTU6_9HEXA|nr:unnamed protein product [Allacma fusca]
MAWSLTNFNSTARTTNVEKQLLTGWGKAFQFSWQFCMIVSRVCALAFFAASHQIWIVPVCVLHWTVMLIWLSYLDSKYKKNPQTSRTLEDKSSYGHCTKILQICLHVCLLPMLSSVFAIFDDGWGIETRILF